MKDLNNLMSEIVIQDRMDLVSEMQSIFDQTCDTIDSDSFEKELKYKDKTLLVDLGRQRVSSVGGDTTEVIIRIFNSGNKVSANQEDARISINGDKTQMFDYTNPGYQEITLKDFTPEQVAIMQFVKEDFEKQLAILQGRNQEEVNEIFEGIQEDIAEKIQSPKDTVLVQEKTDEENQIPKSPELITDPSELLPEGMRPGNVPTQDFLRLAAQVARIQGVIELAEKNKLSIFNITIAVLSALFFSEDMYNWSIWLYHKLLALNFIK